MGKILYKVTLFLLALYPMSGFLSAQDTMINREERIYSLSVLWKEIQYSFAFPERFQKVNLDSLYIAYLTRVEQAKSNFEYFRLMSSFLAHFDDAHTRIYMPPSSRPDDMPPIQTGNFGEKIFVSDIAKSMVEKVPLGSEIIKIDRIPVLEYLTDSVYPYISAATAHWKFDKSVTEILYGKPQSVVTVTIKTPKGEIRDVEMIRNYISNEGKEEMADTVKALPINIKIIDGNIGYIQVLSFLNEYVDTIQNTFLKWVPQLKECKGLIIDIRGNRGGSDRAWYIVTACFTQHIYGNWKQFSRKHVPTFRSWGESLPEYEEYYWGTAMEEIERIGSPTANIPESLQLHQPLIILSGQYVGSAAEFFLLSMKDRNRATIVGEPSVGCLSTPTFYSLPGGYQAMIATMKCVNVDGSQPNDTGILPDIEVKRDYNAYLQGRDNMLERALQELNKIIR